MMLRPYGVVVGGRLEFGLEVELRNGRVESVRPCTGQTEPYVLSPAFVNAHSHLEYRGLMDRVDGDEYMAWIARLTELKAEQDAAEVERDCRLAAEENRRTGVALVAEHSDRPFAGAALAWAGLDGLVFQEVITLRERDDPMAKLRLVEERAACNRCFRPTTLSPHTPYTVDEATLRRLNEPGRPLSIHVAESVHENALLERGDGPLAKFAFRPVAPPGARVVDYLADLGYLRPGVQFVHACDLNAREAERLAEAGVAVAHCPRSNTRLRTPPAPIREYLDAGVKVGLGLDSAASAGPIDMFAEMRGALQTAQGRGRPLSPEEVWAMATTTGAASLGFADWDIVPGSSAPLIEIRVPGAENLGAVIDRGSPDRVEWVLL